MHSVNNSNTFLAYYNQLDKYFGYVLWLTKYMPFTEKVSTLCEWRYTISSFVKLYQNKLRYFGDLRNQLVHWFRLDNEHYVLASDHAIREVRSMYEEARMPKTVSDVFKKPALSCTTTDILKDVVALMQEHAVTHVPVYTPQWTFFAVLSEGAITHWLAQELGNTTEADLMKVQVGDLPLEHEDNRYAFVDKRKSIYDIDDLFTQASQEGKHLWVVFITMTGETNEPIEGMITVRDLPQVSEYFVL